MLKHMTVAAYPNISAQRHPDKDSGADLVIPCPLSALAKEISSNMKKVVALLLFASSLDASAAPITRAEAEVLSFAEGSTVQNTVTALTDDGNTLTSGWVNASYSAAQGMVLEVAPGTYSFGFGSYVPGNYTGPGAMYLHRVVITDQNGDSVLDESFDGWSQVSTSASGNITESEYSTTGGNTWYTYGDGASYYTGLGAPFEAVDASGDAGIVYPLDGEGPFSVLSKTLVTAPSGTTELRVNVEWRYNVSIFAGAENRTFSIGVRQGDVPTEELFSFSAPEAPTPPPAPVPAMPLFGLMLLAGITGLFGLRKLR